MPIMSITTGRFTPIPTTTGTSARILWEVPSRTTKNQDNYTQELRVQSTDPTARVVWTAGAFFSVNRTYSLSAVSDPRVDQLYEYTYGTTIASLYGAATNPDGSTYLPRGDS